jgi:uncharacterized protein
MRAMVEPRRNRGLAFGLGAPVGAVGGLIGLGGAEFRLPLLVGVMRYPARQAVPLNLAVSLFTVCAAAITRLAIGGGDRITALVEVGAIIAALLGGGMVGAWLGAAWLGRISDRVLHRAILVLLVGIGGLLLYEAFAAWEATALVRGDTAIIATGLGIGIAIGMVSSLLGVAGGELIIPTLILIFGVEIKLAGTAALLISLPTMIVGIARHRRNGGFAEPADLRLTVVPMGIGSILGAVAGGVAVGLVSAAALKLILGFILIASAIKIFLAEAH